MHELSIVTSIISTATSETEKAGGSQVREIVLEIGKLAGVEMSSFWYVWPLCINKTVLENARVTIGEPEGRGRCAECGAEFAMEKIYDNCPDCNSPFKEIIQGKELKIKKLIIKQ